MSNSAGPGLIYLAAQRVGGQSIDEVAVTLTERIDSSHWRGAVIEGPPLRPGDELRFGDQSNRVCFLGTLNAEVVAVEPDGVVRLRFEFYGAALDEMIAALTEA